MTLANLKLTAAKKPTQISAVIQRRNKLVMRLREQIELAKAEQTGTAYMLSQIAHTRPKRSAAAEGRHAPAGRIIPMTAPNPFYTFHKLELIKREKFKQ